MLGAVCPEEAAISSALNFFWSPSLKLNQLKAVVAVAKHGSLRAASRHLSITQPAITRAIQEIEKDLGAALFERTSKGVRLTPIGKVMVSRAKLIANNIQQAYDEVNQLKGEAKGSVSFGISSTAGHVLLPKTLSAFRKRYPNITIRITESQFPGVKAMLEEGDIDFYVGAMLTGQSQRQFNIEPLFQDRRAILARRENPFSNVRLLSDLRDARWVRPALNTQQFDSDFDANYSALGLDPDNVILHAHSAQMTLMVLETTDLLTIAPIRSAALHLPLSGGCLTALPMEKIMPEINVSLIQRIGMPLTPVAEHFCDFLRRSAVQLQPIK